LAMGRRPCLALVHWQWIVAAKISFWPETTPGETRWLMCSAEYGLPIAYPEAAVFR
jgi:hypothetical protein